VQRAELGRRCPHIGVEEVGREREARRQSSDSHAPPGACWGETAATEPQASATAGPRAVPGRDEVGMDTVAGLLHTGA
jgi:hypothetical protein